MKTPESIKPFADQYHNNAWQQYTLQELGNWVHLLSKRSTHRAEPTKKAKDLQDAQNYLDMMQSHLDSLK